MYNQELLKISLACLKHLTLLLFTRKKNFALEREESIKLLNAGFLKGHLLFYTFT